MEHAFSKESDEEDKDNKKEVALSKVGGFYFYLSLLALFFLSLSNIESLRALISLEAGPAIGLFLIASILGIMGSHLFIRGSFSVLLHELKHSIVSNLSGNKSKGWTIKKNSGEFRYEYTKDTAHMNAIIGLAPYLFPLFLIVAALVAIPLSYRSHELTIILIGFAAGVDLHLNIRDISPVQTDLTTIRGGYWVALLYITAMNFVIFTLVLSWVVAQGNGLLAMAQGLYVSIEPIVRWARGE